MSHTIFVVLLLGLFSLVIVPSLSSNEGNSPSAEKYKFLLLGSITGGSRYLSLARSGRVLARQGHRVVSVVSSSIPTHIWQNDVGVLSIVVFNSSYAKHNRTDVLDNISRVALEGRLHTFFGPLLNGKDLEGKLDFMTMLVQECDDLLGNSATMKRLHEERFDMLVADDVTPCGPLLAQALDIPFILNSGSFMVPSRQGYWNGLPVHPSYIPERVMGLTDRMTFLQRVQNVLAHYYYSFTHFYVGLADFRGYDKLKVKYNIKPEISTFESYKQALLHFAHGSFGLEFPRPIQPNMLDGEVAKFLDTAQDGVVLFSLGSFVNKMKRDQAQVFANAFSMLPFRVLWQSGANLTGLSLGNNTMFAKWLPLTHVMEHANVKVFVTHAGSFGTNEAMWAGLAMVGIPLFEDQMDNMVRVEARGAGLTLDIASLTSQTLSETICRIMTEPRFRKNAQRVSKIMRDLQNTPNPEENVARWILHVTKFGGDHLRPAVLDLNFVQTYLLDVYLFIALVLASVIVINLSVCHFCWKCLRGKGPSGGKFKKE
ncbi:UDP-glucuronosyltransferase 2B33-like [Acanthaster planci]|uniref:UDP-glucuronosyltransferase 2B33-like n=1 Tax=Acanthaster planci TaxID=133434 RepID=A0A8B7YSS0_ACAPL|nr:UDP-glucuronosyltransferase 2B33-like [Acanthaster planci]